MRLLITGISGFAGSYLAEHLMAEGGNEVYGTVRETSRMDNLDDFRDSLRLLACELTHPEEVREALDEAQPERVYHLAAHSFPGDSHRAPWRTLENNLQGQLNLLEALKGSSARVLVVGSALEYGPVQPEELPVGEEAPLRPSSAYALSKAGQTLMGAQYHLGFGLQVVGVRPFNHTGPRRGERFVESNFAAQIARAEKGLGPPVIRVGDLACRRDFTDVRDVVRAYRLALEHGEPGKVYNVCSGNSWMIGKLLDLLISMASIEIEVQQDPDRLRPDDVAIVEGSNQRIRRLTGWEPVIPLEQSLAELLDYWRARV